MSNKRLPDNYVIIPIQDIITKDDDLILRIENFMIKEGFLEENDEIVFNPEHEYIVNYTMSLELLEVGESSGITGPNPPLFPIMKPEYSHNLLEKNYSITKKKTDIHINLDSPNLTSF